MSNGKYILEGRNAVPCDDIETWGKAMTSQDKIVAQTKLTGGVMVSTVFLGLDHSFRGDGPPLLFETMIFKGPQEGYQTRCTTWGEAVAQHFEALETVMK